MICVNFLAAFLIVSSVSAPVQTSFPFAKSIAVAFGFGIFIKMQFLFGISSAFLEDLAIKVNKSNRIPRFAEQTKFLFVFFSKKAVSKQKSTQKTFIRD